MIDKLRTLFNDLFYSYRKWKRRKQKLKEGAKRDPFIYK